MLLHDNNENGGAFAANLSDYIISGFVQYFTVSGEAQQLPVYQRCSSHSATNFSWLAAIDVDEFLVIEDAKAKALYKPREQLKMILEDFRFFPGALDIHILTCDSSQLSMGRGIICGVLEAMACTHLASSMLSEHEVPQCCAHDCPSGTPQTLA